MSSISASLSGPATNFTNLLKLNFNLVDSLQSLAQRSGVELLTLNNKTLLPIVQGGMGVGVSASRLAGTTARFGAMGTISSVDLRRLHADLWEQTRHLEKEADARELIDRANLVALDREIKKARTISQGNGLIAVNVMKALSAYDIYVKQALESGADAVVVGAGLPLDLPDLAQDFPKAALIPILSDARGVQLVVKKWLKKGRLPSAIVLEHPRLAGGHLGAAKVSDLESERFEFETAIPQIIEAFREMGIEGQIPLIAAGGISNLTDIKRLQSLGASAVQLGTAFAVTQECDAHDNFKHVLAGAKPEDIVEFVSVAGLPARGVKTPWLEKYIRIEPILKQRAHAKERCNMAFDCLAHCGLRDGKSEMGQFCIDQQLGHALDGDVQKGLFFRGKGKLPFGSEIRPVQDLLAWLLGGVNPATASVGA
ncbi:MAG: nitronate monooxygenase family protein [Burkholderiaceae bacterium]|nr:nitronate monooxygenase family protein [Burkholderiaceae bacterium]